MATAQALPWLSPGAHDEASAYAGSSRASTSSRCFVPRYATPRPGPALLPDKEPIHGDRVAIDPAHDFSKILGLVAHSGFSDETFSKAQNTKTQKHRPPQQSFCRSTRRCVPPHMPAAVRCRPKVSFEHRTRTCDNTPDDCRLNHIQLYARLPERAEQAQAPTPQPVA